MGLLDKRTLLLLLLHGPAIALLPELDEPGHLVAQKDDLELGEPSRGVVAALRALAERHEPDAHVLVVGLALSLDGVQLNAEALGGGGGGVVMLGSAHDEGEGVGELFLYLVGFLVEGFGAGVGVEEVAVGGLELCVAFVEAAAGVDHVVHALEAAGGEVRAREGDEVVEEVVVDVRGGFDAGGRGGGGGRVHGEGHAGFEDLVGGGRGGV